MQRQEIHLGAGHFSVSPMMFVSAEEGVDRSPCPTYIDQELPSRFHNCFTDRAYAASVDDDILVEPGSAHNYHCRHRWTSSCGVTAEICFIARNSFVLHCLRVPKTGLTEQSWYILWRGIGR